MMTTTDNPPITKENIDSLIKAWENGWKNVRDLFADTVKRIYETAIVPLYEEMMKAASVENPRWYIIIIKTLNPNKREKNTGFYYKPSS